MSRSSVFRHLTNDGKSDPSGFYRETPKPWPSQNVMEKWAWTGISCCLGLLLVGRCSDPTIAVRRYRERFCEELPSHRKRTNRTGKGAKPCERRHRREHGFAPGVLQRSCTRLRIADLNRRPPGYEGHRIKKVFLNTLKQAHLETFSRPKINFLL